MQPKHTLSLFYKFNLAYYMIQPSTPHSAPLTLTLFSRTSETDNYVLNVISLLNSEYLPRKIQNTDTASNEWGQHC